MDDVAVVGAGAVGATAARELAERGAAVTLFERDEVAAGASGRAAGVCYDAFADRLDADLARRALDHFRDLSGTGDFRFTDCPYVWWARETSRSPREQRGTKSRGPCERAASPPVSRRSERGRCQTNEASLAEGGSPNERAENEVSREHREGDGRHAAAAVRETATLMAERGLDVSLVDPGALGRRFPALETADVAAAAAVAENAGYADSGAYTRATADAAVRAGADLRTETPVAVRPGPEVVPADGVDPVGGDTVGGPYDAVLVAAGAHTRQVVADVAPLAVKPYRVQALVTAPVDVTAPMLYDATGGYYLRPRDGGLLVGDVRKSLRDFRSPSEARSASEDGTEPVERDPDDWDPAADDWFVAACRDHERAALGRSWPARRAWAGLCTATPDGDPLVGELADGVYVATGWQGHGFMRAPAFAAELATAMLSGEDEAGSALDAFAPTRFEGDEAFEIVEGMALD